VFFSIHKDHLHASRSLADALSHRLKKVNQEIVVVCVGTDRSSGDSLGPLVGSHLSSIEGFHVYGTLENPVHANNLLATQKTISIYHPNAFIIAVDAGLGKRESIGKIQLTEGPLSPGKGLGKELPTIGDISILGIVNAVGLDSFVTLLTTRLYEVMTLSTIISDALYTSIRKKQRAMHYLS